MSQANLIEYLVRKEIEKEEKENLLGISKK